MSRSQLDPKETIRPKSYTQELAIPTEVAEERVVGKLLQLDLPEGKVSDRRKAELAVREAEKEKKRAKRQREGDCGLAGRRKRKSLGRTPPDSIQCVCLMSDLRFSCYMDADNLTRDLLAMKPFDRCISFGSVTPPNYSPCHSAPLRLPLPLRSILPRVRGNHQPLRRYCRPILRALKPEERIARPNST